MSYFHPNLAPLIFAGISIALSGCSRYAFSVNDNELYRPAPLYTDFRVADEALAACIEQTIHDKRITKVKQLQSLNCSNAGIRSLAGLEHFAWLQKLDVSNNNISDSEALRMLNSLQYLKISGNPQLDCADLAPKNAQSKRETLAPEHCSHKATQGQRV